MMKSRILNQFLLTLGLIVVITDVNAQQVHIDVNVNMEHAVGGLSTFDRQKYITVHSSLSNNNWKDEQDKLDYLFDSLDVYAGRDNGGINWWLQQMDEDLSRLGYVDSNDVISTGASRSGRWASSIVSQYDDKADIMIGGQHHAVWPGWKDGWELQGGDAVGEYMAHYVNHFHRGINDNTVANGQPAPRYLEIINEPGYMLHDDPLIPAADKVPFIDIFTFHRDAARAFKRYNTTTKVGGYTVAFPFYDVDNFQRWEQRMKMFVDTAGADMDYYSLHFYDVNRHALPGNKTPVHFKGSRMDATLDMLEQYGMLKFGEVKPMLISEFGGKDPRLQDRWNAKMDWQTLKAMTPMLMQYMERPDVIEKAIPFIMIKAAWSAEPHSWRLMRQVWEPQTYEQNNYNVEYVFTENIKLYQLWAKVNGTRVDTRATNPDVLCDAYVEGNKMYLILNSLNATPLDLSLNLAGYEGNEIDTVMVKRLYSVNDRPVLDTLRFSNLTEIVLEPEASIIAEYTFKNPVLINQTSEEGKYYASDYYKDIQAHTPLTFQIDNVVLGTEGEAVLRVSFGRAHQLSTKPEVLLNGVKLNVPENFAGITQEYRDEGFFGMLQIPVPYEILSSNNTVSVTFDDAGGKVSSVILQTFDMSIAPLRSDTVQSVKLYPDSISIGIGQERVLTPYLIPSYASDNRVNWVSNDTTLVKVNTSGIVTGVSIGQTSIVVTTVDGGYTDSCIVVVGPNRVPVPVDSVLLSPKAANMIVGDSLSLQAVTLPVDADDKTITWSSNDLTIATVDQSGNVLAIGAGTAEITATGVGGIFDFCTITSKIKVPGSLTFDDRAKYSSTVYNVGGELEVTCNFKTTTGNTVSEDGVKFWLREIDSNWNVVKDYVAFDTGAAGDTAGTASTSISLENVIPTADLPSGNFYFLWATFIESDGTNIRGESVTQIQIENDATAINDVAYRPVTLYPNPTKDRVYIEGSDSFQQVKLYDLVGKLRLATDVNQNTFDIQGLSKGVYLVELSNSTQKAISRIILE